MLVDSEVNLNNSGVIIPDGMLAKVAGQNRFKVGNGVSTWSKLEYISSIALGNGLAFDENGQIVVDFSVMPTEKFEQLLKSIWVPIKLTANKNFYVDGAKGSDTLSAGRGESVNAPFKTIQACVNYVTQNYNVNAARVEIYLANGTFTETITLPEYSKTTGLIEIRPVTIGQVTIRNANNNAGIFNISGGTWYISYFSLTVDNVSTFTTTRFRGQCFGISGNSTNVTITGCSCTIDLTNLPDTVTFWNCALVVVASGANVTWACVNKQPELHAIAGSKANIRAMFSVDNATLSTAGIYIDSAGPSSTLVSGSATTFVDLNNKGFILIGEAASQKKMQFEGSFTGMRYRVQTGSTLNTNGAGTSYFPGTAAGTVDTSTYSWYR